MTKRLHEMTLSELAVDIGRYAQDKGWNDKERSFDEWTALFHSEISEAYEEYRDGRGLTEVYDNTDSSKILDIGGFLIPKPEGIAVELADTIIRILHFCDVYSIDIGRIVSNKMEYNKGRPYRHGGKVS